ncbi:MAG: recombinase family protein [Actinomyces sp.]|uniref:recombinase family protein n=1 Tax=Actinomyces ihuae TaxID=1673722 RepID=UPI000AFAC30E|nr:recombinase family protein [Actinomyces ihuae]MDU1352036.1 recombinase family protein [Actinomyces sp.]MDU2983995.1 recombinase family protein [Actinomyces sp.]MDU6661058.1 recombinase family protein [Actinomyces sp.]MDU6745544.1 recombinase family protein [Actinomyces sp.]
MSKIPLPFSAQVDYYEHYIKNHDGWQYVDIYTDEGISGTSTKHREGFNRMIADALAGRIDMIVTKSVSCFARNTVDSLTTVRKLKDKGVEVFFEKENIWTLDSKGELLITIMSSLAQEESRSISENVTWGHRKRFQDGKVYMPYGNFLGYNRGPDGKPVINPEQAQIVRRIYRQYLEGMSIPQIATSLEADGIPTPMRRAKWSHTTIHSILTNEKYKGDALLQKRFTVDFLTKQRKTNEGEVPQYYVTGSRPAIIDPETWELVRYELAKNTNQGRRERAFTGMVYCAHCGAAYGSKTWHSTDKYRTIVWQCNQKFAVPHPKKMPVLRDSQLQTIFQTTLAKLIKSQQLIDWDYLITTTSDTTALEEQALQQASEIEVTTRLINQAITRNAHHSQNQDDYQERFTQLKARQREAITAYETTQVEIERRHGIKAKLTRFKKTIQNATLSQDFDRATLRALCQHIQITPSGKASVIFADGTKIKIPADSY